MIKSSFIGRDDNSKIAYNTEKKDYPLHFALSKEDFYSDIKRISSGDANLCGVNTDILAYSLVSYFEEDEILKNLNNSKYYPGHNFGLKMKYLVMDKSKARFDFFEKLRINHAGGKETSIGNMCRVTELVEKKSGLLTDINELDDVTLLDKVALVIFEFSPIDIYTEKVLYTEYFSFSFVFFNLKNDRLEMAINLPFEYWGDDSEEFRETINKDKFITAPLLSKSNKGVEYIIKSLFFNY